MRWPTQLVDALLAYCYLIYPPLDAPHKPIAPSKIIFAGDSSGVDYSSHCVDG
jgi:acetyl esterase/lipase